MPARVFGLRVAAKLTAVVTLVAGLFAVGAGAAAPAWAFTGVNGKIAYVGPGKVRTDTSDIWMANKDGSSPVDLTPRDGMWDASPTWFVEPGRVLYVAGKNGGPGDLYDDLLTSKRGPTNLTNTSDQYEADPSYSTGGGRITFARGPWTNDAPGPSDIWGMTWTGGSPQNLTSTADSRTSNTDPVWSPDQQMIAYVRSIAGVPSVRLMGPGGLNVRKPIDLGVTLGDQPVWNSHRVGGSFQLVFVLRDALFSVKIPTVLPVSIGTLPGIQPIQLTHPLPGVTDANPVFSPDGTKILFDRGGKTMVMASTPGSTPNALNPRSATDPDWEPLCTRTAPARGGAITGTNGDDLLCGGAGNDTITALGGDDVIFAGQGADTVSSGGGNDFVLDGTGSAADVIHGGPGNDNLQGSDGNDKLYGDTGNDQLNGGTGDDYLDGGAGDDQVTGGPGSDTMLGGPDDDLLSAIDGSGGDSVDGGTGTDTCFTDNGDNKTNCEIPHGLA